MTYTADVSMFPYFKKDEVKTVKKVVVINDTQKKVWRLEAQNEMLRKELEDANRIANDYADESFGYEKGYMRLKEENNKLKEENKEWELAGRSADWAETPEELCRYLAYCGDPDEYNQLIQENEELKEEKNKYFGYLKDKDLECEEQREHAEALLVSKNVLHKEVEEQTTTIERLLAENKGLKSDDVYQQTIIQKFNDENNMFMEEIKDLKKSKEELCETIVELKSDASSREDSMFQTLNKKRKEESDWAIKKIEELKEEIKDLKKSKQELYETIMELKNPVTNYDERCGVLKARVNHAYLMGFMYGHDIDPDVSRSVDNQEEFDGVIEHMSKEVENVIDTYLQDSLIYGTHMTLNEVIREKLDDIIDQAIDDGIVKEIDDSSDED